VIWRELHGAIPFPTLVYCVNSLTAGAAVELFINVAQVNFYRPRTDIELGGNSLVGKTPGDKVHYFALARGYRFSDATLRTRIRSLRN